MNYQNPSSLNAHATQQVTQTSRTGHIPSVVSKSFNNLPNSQEVDRQTTLQSNDTLNQNQQTLEGLWHRDGNYPQVFYPEPSHNNLGNSFEIKQLHNHTGQATLLLSQKEECNMNSMGDLSNPLNMNMCVSAYSTTLDSMKSTTPKGSNSNLLSAPQKSLMRRGKSPLDIFVMSDNKERNTSRTSRQSKPLDREERLQKVITIREEEINSLRRELGQLKQSNDNCLINGDGVNHKDYRESYRRLKEDLDSFMFENQRLKEAVEKQEKDFKKQLFELKLKYEENARKNIQIMQQELVFQYANNDDEAIKALKQTIQHLEGKL